MVLFVGPPFELREKEAIDLLKQPYHMRRIKLIADRVFDGTDMRLCFVPSSYEKVAGLWWSTRAEEVKWVLGELVKIGWFGVYGRLPASFKG